MGYVCQGLSMRSKDSEEGLRRRQKIQDTRRYKTVACVDKGQSRLLLLLLLCMARSELSIILAFYVDPRHWLIPRISLTK